MALWRDTIVVSWYVQDLSLELHDAKTVANMLCICGVAYVCLCVCNEVLFVVPVSAVRCA